MEGEGRFQARWREGQVGEDRPELGTGAVRKEVGGEIGQSSGHLGTDIR